MSSAAIRGWLRKTVETMEMVKVSHSVFALPFALVSLLLVSKGQPAPGKLAWILLAMISARTAAMAFNRLTDHGLDADNPRTADRALPAGRLGRRFVLGTVLLSVAGFVVAAAMLNPLCLALSPVALGVVLGYSYAKRFTVLCHVWLGVALGLSPLAAWIAVTGVFDRSLLVPASLALAVTAWVAGFDVIYACQDESFDRARGLFSLPARIGSRRALQVAAGFHVVAVGALAVTAPLAGLGGFYLGGVVAVGLLLCAEHVLARPRGGRRLHAAFFHANSAVGIVLLAGVGGDLWW